MIEKDRNYYRLETNRDLIEEAKHNPNAELSIVLGERLRRAVDEIYWLEDQSDEDR